MNNNSFIEINTIIPIPANFFSGTGVKFEPVMKDWFMGLLLFKFLGSFCCML